jgi:hypothetical protein
VPSANNHYYHPRISGFGVLNSANQPNVDKWCGADAQLDAGSAAPMPRWNECPGGSSLTKAVPSTCPTGEVLAVSHGQSRRAETAAQGPCPARIMLFPSSRPNTRASGGPRLQDDPGPGRRVVARHSAGIPSRRRRKRSSPRAGGKIVHRMRCSTLPPALGPLRDELADATGYPLPPPPAMRHSRPRRVPLACN